MKHYAHTLPPPKTSDDWEPLPEHLKWVAEGDADRLVGAAGFADAFGAPEWGRLLGWWHDLGKYNIEFQNYLHSSTASAEGSNFHCMEVSGRVDHSTAGAQHAVGMGRAGQLLAYCIAGHHAGLPDNVGSASSLKTRLEDESKLKKALLHAPAELLNRPLPLPPKLRHAGNQQRVAFTLGFFTRMLFSCLVDADFLATEKFMNPEQAGLRPTTSASLSELLARLDSHLEEKRRGAPETIVNRCRHDVLASCREKAKLPPGLFSLNVPTGGGKTLSSLAFALTHAVEHDLRRVVYAIPFTSIIEQTADVFRNAIGDEDVLEHHSNLDPNDPKKQTERTRLAAENFDASIVVTTNVQLFESLFACRTSRCRKLHRLAKSVIILDEAQALPPNLLAPTLAALDELARNYGTTVVLCTATQPAVEKRDGFSIGLENVTPIIDDPQRLHDALKRTHVEPVGRLTNEELVTRLTAERQVLCVVNSRAHAAELFKLLGDDKALHLSALMRGHRTKVVEEIRRRLKPDINEPCRVISTQVIEAGVDVDFPAVFRAAAGLDSVAQAAGRCNREGRLQDEHDQPRLGNVVVFDYDIKAYRTVSMIRRGAGHFREVAPDHAADLLSPQAIESYFRLHYWQQGGDGGRGWDEGREKQSVMDCFAPDMKSVLHAQFREAADRYQLIDDGQTPILVPYGKQGRALIRRLEQLPDPCEPKQLRAFDRAAQRYTVGVYEHALRKLLENGVLLERFERYYLANDLAYDKRLGLRFDAVGLDPELLVQ